MLLLQQTMLDEYKRKDVILSLLNSAEQDGDQHFASHQWLLDTLPKRMAFELVYGDLLSQQSSKPSVLDVGGGFTALSRVLINHCNYTLLDLMVHDSHAKLHEIETEMNCSFWKEDDWYSFELNDDYDLVIANDLFPNVDQRLEMFLEKYLPICSEMRLILTYYNVPRWYDVKRLNADEVLHMLAWDGVQLQRVLEKFHDRIFEPDLSMLEKNTLSLFPNQRQLCAVTMWGEKHETT